MTRPAPKPKPGSRLTVQGWQNLVLSAMGVVVLAGLVAGGLLMHRTDATVARADRRHPARTRRGYRCRPRCAIRRPPCADM